MDNCENLLELENHVREFTKEISATVQAFTGDNFTFTYAATEARVAVRLEQKGEEAGIIPLRWHGSVILGIRPSYNCSWDSTGSYLAVESSSFAVYAGIKPNEEPLFRVEYDRDSNSKPSSHFHVHAHRDEFTHLLGLTKKLNTSDERKVEKHVNSIPSLSKFHFPTGGRRFRPSLEDVLEVLRIEFNLDVNAATWKSHLEKSRLKWRRIQAAAIIRDCPRTALDILIDDFGLPRPANWTCPEDNVSKIIRA